MKKFNDSSANIKKADGCGILYEVLSKSDRKKQLVSPNDWNFLYHSFFKVYFRVFVMSLSIILYTVHIFLRPFLHDLSKFTRVAGNLSCSVIRWIWTFIGRALPKAYIS